MVIQNTKTINGTQGYTDYAYNRNGSLSILTYPSGDQAQYTYSTAGRVTEVQWLGILEGGPLATNVSYTSPGEIASYVNGANVTVTDSYNSRLQPSTLQAATSQGTIFSLTYNLNWGSGDNGNVSGITNNLNSARSQTFGYDSLNRLTSAGTSSTWGDSYGYDSWGNLLSKTVTRGSGENWSNPVNANNQMTAGLGYDPAGNLTSINGYVYNIFNAENQWTYQTTYLVSYLYDGDGRRVKSSGGASGTRVYWHDEGGNVIEEPGQNGGKLYFYLNGTRIAYLYDSSFLYFYYGDHLGTTRLITDNAGHVCYDADYFPWGAEQDVYTNSCPQNYKFTGKERDPDMGVDYFGARFYSSNGMSRFFSPDPILMMQQKMTDPQQWNMYSYVRNDPLNMVDTNGKWPTDIHNQIIDKAFPGLSDHQRSILKSASARMDCLICQVESNSFQHSMRAPNENPAKAKQDAQNFVKTEEHLAQVDEKGGTPSDVRSINDKSLGMFGNAAHTVADATSPAHTDAQGNPLPWNPYSVSGVEAHEAAESTITPEQMNNAVTAVRQAFQDTYGQTAAQQAATPPPPRQKEQPQ